MITEIFTALSNAILAFINNVIEFITSPLTDYINSIVTQYPPLAGYIDFVKASVNLLVPYQQIIVGIAIIAPIYLYNLTINVFFFIKSFLPLSGGNG